MKYKHITIRLFIITTVFLVLFVGAMLLFQMQYFGKYYAEEKQKQFESAVNIVIRDLNGTHSSKENLLTKLKTLGNEHGLIVVLYSVDDENVISLDDASNEIFKKLIYGILSTSELPAKPKIYMIKQGQNQLQYISTVASVTVNDSRYLMAAATSLQPVEEAVSTLQNSSWIVYIIVILFSLILSIIISRLIAKPLVREIEHEKKLDHMRREFIANASHELKTPISIISGYSESLLDNIVSGEERTEYEQIIFDEVQKMGKLVRDLLEISMLQNEKFELHKTEVSLDSLINKTLHRLSGKIREKEIKLSLDGIIPTAVLADEAMIEVAVLNLASNAISHTQIGGSIRIGLTTQNTITRFEIENTGQQIPEEMLNFIWDSFYRVDKARNREEGRYGLGLAIVKSIIEKHDGQVGVCNMAEGVLFYFELMCK